MNDRRPYSYTVLRYVHDVVTGEFANVGIILHVPSLPFAGVRVRTSIGRLRSVFPDLDRHAFRRTMEAARRSVESFEEELRSLPLLGFDVDAVGIAARALPRDDSALQWTAQAGTGLTADPQRTLERLFERFVSRYDRHRDRGRSDDDVWRVVREKLDARRIEVPLQEKTIAGPVDEIVFEHAWKNGVWHVYEPMSFDLADAQGIKAKAREWLGHVTAVCAGDVEPFRPHVIVAKPQSEALLDAYRSALMILRKAPMGTQVVEEDDIDGLVERIAAEMREHANAGRA